MLREYAEMIQDKNKKAHEDMRCIFQTQQRRRFLAWL